MASQLVTVFGATGNQGGAIIKTFLAHPVLRSRFSLRGITRNKTSDRALALAKSGVEVVEADLNDSATLVAAVTGSAVVFGVTNYWDPSTLEKETTQGISIADACVAASVPFLIWSSLPGEVESAQLAGSDAPVVPVVHFESKARVGRYILTSLAGKIDAALLNIGFFADNLAMPAFVPRPTDPAKAGAADSSFALSLPLDPADANIPVYTPSDMGIYVAALVLAPRDQVAGKSWYAASAVMSGNDIAAAISSATGRSVHAVEIPIDTWAAKLPDFIREELRSNLELIRAPGYFGPGAVASKLVAEFHKLIADTEAGTLTSMEQFSKSRIQLE